MIDPELTLDEEHVYRKRGVVVTGVTTVLDSCGLISDFAKSENAALRGSLVHKACYYLAMGQLDWNSVDERIVGFVLAYKKFLDEVPNEPIELEQGHLHREYLYAGTLDALVESRKYRRFLYDIKTGSPAK